MTITEAAPTATPAAPTWDRPGMAPGVYFDLDEDAYHADPGSLSVSGAKTILKAPALYEHERKHHKSTRAMDLGSAAHALVLGVGATLFEVEHDSYRTKAAQTARGEAKARGEIALLSSEMRQVEDMAERLAQDAAAMEALSGGVPEVSAFWLDNRYDICRRGRFDYLRDDGISDYKTCVSVHPDAIVKAVTTYGYHMQNAWYLDLAAAHNLDTSGGFTFVFQQKAAPYLTQVVRLDDAAIMRGRALNDEALETYARCTATGVWRGYTEPGTVLTLSLPGWARGGENTPDEASEPDYLSLPDYLLDVPALGDGAF